MLRSLAVFICGTALAFLALGVTVTPNAWCAEPEWVLLDENQDSRFYYDKSVTKTDKPNQGGVLIRTRVVYTPAGKADALKILSTDKLKKLHETRYLHELNCKSGKSRLLESTHLDQEGVTLKSTDLSTATEWEDIPPGARIGLAVGEICSR